MVKLIVTLLFIVVIGFSYATVIGFKKINLPAEKRFLENIKVHDIYGEPFNFSTYHGQVILLVNIASQCGFSKQCIALENLYKTHKDKGFVVIGVPSNDFGKQEPGSNEQICDIYQKQCGITFPLLEKIKGFTK